MADRPRMSPEERMRAAHELRRRALKQWGLTPEQRVNMRRIAQNLVACNMLEAKRRLGLLDSTGKPGPKNTRRP